MLTNKWFVLLGWSVIVLLLLLLIAIRQMRKEKQTKHKARRFQDYADSLNLSVQEQNLLKTIAQLAGLRQENLIFSMREAFNSGLVQLKQRVLADKYDQQEWMSLQKMILGLREKLGFAKNRSGGVNNRSARGQTSRQVQPETPVIISLMNDPLERVIHATVLENTSYEILIKCEEPVDCKSGDIWLVQFDRGAITWEFRAICIELSEQTLKLSHSDSIRFVSRRQFSEVSTNTPAQIALFEAFKDVTDSSHLFEVEFKSAEVFEIAGPCIRLKTLLKPQVRQRVILMFELEPGRIIQDVADVREIEQNETNNSVMVEMVGITNREIDELTRVVGQFAMSEQDYKATAEGDKEVSLNV